MCGISLVVGNYKGVKFSSDPDIQPFFRDASIVGSVRGTDSTGIYQIADEKDVRMVYSLKRAVDGATFEQLRRSDAYFKDAPTALATVLHHRKATSGKINDGNAHPFHVPTIDVGKSLIGVHNGSLSNYDRGKFDVDSEWALAELAKSDNYLETLSKFRGPYVFAFYDQRYPDRMFIARGKERTFAFGIQEGANKNYLIGTSEADMLYWLAKRNRLSFTENKVIECAENTLYTIPFNDVRGYTSAPIPVPAVATPPVHLPAPYYGSNRRTWGGYEGDRSYYKQETELEKISAALGIPVTRAARQPGNKNPTKAPAQQYAAQSESTKTKPTTTSCSTDLLGGQDTFPTKSSLELEDQKYAEDMQIAGEDGVFDLKMYDPELKIAYGTCLVGDGKYADTHQAVMFGVEEDLGEALSLADWVEVTVIGAYDDELTTDEINVIVSKPKTLAASGASDAARITRLVGSEGNVVPFVIESGAHNTVH